MSVANRARSKPPRSPDSWRNQGPFSAKPSRSRGVLALGIERLRLRLISGRRCAQWKGSPCQGLLLCVLFGKAILPDHVELAGFPWLRGRFGRSAAIPIIPAAPGAPSLIRLLPVLRKRGQYKTAIVERNGVVWHLRIEAVPLLRCCCCASAVPVGSRHKSHVMRRRTRGWDAYSAERLPAQLNAKVVLEPPFGAATLPIMNRRSCIGAARKGCSCVFSNPGWD